jgi:hypothetical protein
MTAPAASVELLVTEALRDLGQRETADAVANEMRAAGIKGTQDDTCTCPLANYLTQLPGVDQVEVLDNHVYLWVGDQAEPAVIELAESVSNFVYLFDQGVFLDLVDLPAVK